MNSDSLRAFLMEGPRVPTGDNSLAKTLGDYLSNVGTASLYVLGPKTPSVVGRLRKRAKRATNIAELRRIMARTACRMSIDGRHVVHVVVLTSGESTELKALKPPPRENRNAGTDKVKKVVGTSKPTRKMRRMGTRRANGWFHNAACDARYERLWIRLNSISPSEWPVLNEQLRLAQIRCPSDYRFTYARAIYTAQLGDSVQACTYLCRAATIAIRNGDARRMLARMLSDGRHDDHPFWLLSHGSKHWVTVVSALERRDESELAMESMGTR